MSKKAYNHLPRLELNELKYGDVINMTPGKLGPLAPLKIVYWFIINQQRKKYGKPYHRSIHTWWHSWNGRIFEVAPPRCRHAIIYDLKDLNPNVWYPVCRYKDWEIETAEERQIIWNAMTQLVGFPYDYGQLLAILINEVIGWPEAKYLPIFDLGRKRKVCSVLVRGLWMTWYEKYAKPRDLSVRRPGGPEHVERTHPALFENSPDFEIIGILNAGAGRRK